MTPVDRQTFVDRVATAPISWGICEVPGWGVQLPVDRVLSEMAELGFTATELGSEGYLPNDVDRLSAVLGAHDLRLLAAFIPLVLHDAAAADEMLASAAETADFLAAAGASYFNTAVVTSPDWKPRFTLTDAEWDHVMVMFDRLDEIVSARGLTQVLHTHVDTVVETADEIQRVVDNSAVAFVLDTAHFAVGGYDPSAFVANHADRVGLVHLKDLDTAVAARLNAEELSLMEAVQQGIFPTIGDGDLPIGKVITQLETGGYDGWYVLEQDVAITGDEPPAGAGPIEGVRASLDRLKAIAGTAGA